MQGTHAKAAAAPAAPAEGESTQPATPMDALWRAVPHVALAVPRLVTQLRAASALRNKAAQFLELEARLGTLTTHEGRRRFVPGVPAGFVARLLCKLETSPAWTERLEWTQSVDRFYLVPAGFEARTTTEAVALKNGGYHYAVSHVVKDTAVAAEDFRWTCRPGKVAGAAAPAPADAAPSAGAPCPPPPNVDVRVSIKRETPLHKEDLQQRVDDMHLVRIKQRRSFRYTPAGEDRVRWAVDVTQVWQRATYMEALAAVRDRVQPTYEVELECRQPLEYLRRLGGDHGRLALTMAMKIADLFAGEPAAALGNATLAPAAL
jgi:hypothetical protein